MVPHRSTDEACSGLTAQFGRDTVRFTEYGRRQVQRAIHASIILISRVPCTDGSLQPAHARPRARRARGRDPAGMDALKRTQTATAPVMMPGTYFRAPSIERTEACRALCEAARPAAADAPCLGGGGDAETLVDRPCVGRLSMVAGTARACCLR
eukprot:COSAG02_NODE_3069_length_7427_cov_7.977211_3_plen_154_part_00